MNQKNRYCHDKVNHTQGVMAHNTSRSTKLRQREPAILRKVTSSGDFRCLHDRPNDALIDIWVTRSVDNLFVPVMLEWIHNTMAHGYKQKLQNVAQTFAPMIKQLGPRSKHKRTVE